MGRVATSPAARPIIFYEGKSSMAIARKEWLSSTVASGATGIIVVAIAILAFAGDWQVTKDNAALVPLLIKESTAHAARIKSLEDRHSEIMSELRYLRQRIDQLVAKRREHHSESKSSTGTLFLHRSVNRVNDKLLPD